jgi:predicted transcriptional regulator of viral defense system
VVRVSRPQPAKGATPAADVAVAALAAEQNAVVSTRQLAACGIDSDAITVRVRRGQLHRVHRGVYAVGCGLLTLRGELTAAALACGQGAVLSHRAAAAWWELLAWEPRSPDVIVPGGAGRRLAGIRPRWSRSLERRDVWRRDRILVTSPARTTLDLAADLSATALRRMVRRALAEGRVSIRQLTEVLDRAPRHRGAARLRAVLADGHVPTLSELEDLALDLLAQAGIERPEVNPELVLDGRRLRPDLLWRQARVVVELDGAAWHGDPLTRRDDADKQAILEAHGHRVLRVTWQQVVGCPRQTLARIQAARTA